MKLSVIIPAYNEKKTIWEIIQKVKATKILKEIIIIDDFSTDGTREYLKKLKDKEIQVFFHDKNYGKSHALRTGIKESKGDIIIIQDADLEYDPGDYYKLVKPIEQGKTKVVYGTRFPTKKGHPSLLYPYQSLLNPFYFGNKILTNLANLLYKANITDEPTCYKVFDAKVLKSINLKSERFEFCPEVTAKVRKKGYKIYEVPIRYNPRTIKEGKKINWKDGIVAIWTLIKYRFVD
ncbi:MAG TPA: glycosyltransferase family 2 protein [Candidatus Paceibacterota bacterium]|nr:glycosyltransferase family 2 protein [Candidatus Paceibacterota bacterium]